MELRAYAASVIEARTLEGKLAPPPEQLTDCEPGDALRYEEPVRPPGLEIVGGGRVKVPKAAGMGDPAQRERVLHAFANHELQATELFAWAVLAFPTAPPAFRRGCVQILAEEQRHCRLYLARLEALGGRFGALPVSGHFWKHIGVIATPLEFVCAVGLTFENANLDFAREYAAGARAAGDEKTARVLDEIHDDEVRHVGFGWRWLREFKSPQESEWEAYLGAVHAPSGPERARGAVFDRASREAAGLSPEFIERLERTQPRAPGGGRR